MKKHNLRIENLTGNFNSRDRFERNEGRTKKNFPPMTSKYSKSACTGMLFIYENYYEILMTPDMIRRTITATKLLSTEF